VTKVLKIFRVVASEFADVDDDTVDTWIYLTDPLVDKRRFGKLHDQALAFLTAHRMYLAGIGQADEDDPLADIGKIGVDNLRRVSSFKEGQTSITFNHDQGDMNAEGDAYYELSKYGMEFLKLRKARIINIVSAGQNITGGGNHWR